MQISKRLIALVALLSAPFVGALAQPAPQENVVAIVGATVLPMVGSDRLADQTVLIRGDSIEAIGPRARVKVPQGAQTLNARGKVLMPGLVDMHVHISPVAGEPGDAAQRALAVMLAHGVTTARGMAGSPNNLVVRGKVEGGAIPGPRIYAAAPALHEKNTATAEQAREAVAKAKAAGFDLIKSHQLADLEVWQAVQDEAKRQGIPVGGHVANSIGLERAMAAGQQVEHLDSVVFAMLPKGAPERQLEFGQIPPPPVVARAVTVSDGELAALARKAAAAKSWHVPTLSLFEKILDMGMPTEQLLAQPAMRFVPDAALKQWAEQRGQLSEMGMTPADALAVRELRRRIAGALHKAGVPLMAGSDTAQAFHLWGPGLHEEIRSLAAAGMTPMLALRAATVVPRDYFRSLPNGGSALGWKADFGTVQKGARADLILLESDPSRDLAALERPSLVIAGGRVYERAALDAMLARAAGDAKAPPPAPVAANVAHPLYVVRHLQKGAGDDPPLTAEGAANAQHLARLLQDRGIKAVFATPTRRAQETAAPLAAAAGVPVTTYNPAKVDELAKAVAAAVGPALIVGHSNTVPDLVATFGGDRPAPIAEDQYGTVFLVEPGQSSVRQLRLGGGERG